MANTTSALIAGFLLLHASSANAGWSCSIDHAYPEVSSLEVQHGKLVATLGTYFFDRKEKVEISGKIHEIYVREFPRLILSDKGVWEKLDVVNANDVLHKSGKQCFEVTPNPEAAREWLGNVNTGMAEGDWYNESVQSCVSDGQYNWGGITFYGAEGGWGVGGLVRQDIENGEIEYVRTYELLGMSTGPLAYFAGTLWFGQTWMGECAGPGSGTGLKRLVFHERSQWYRVKEVPEVCGFAIRDFQEFEGSLWVATELGVSRLIEQDDLRWTNFVPDLEDPSLMREVQCDDLYAELLSSEKFAETEGFDMGFAFDVFWRRLAELRPGFTQRYLRKLHGHEQEPQPQ